MEALVRAGIPAEAMTFLAEHAEVDEAHNRIMKHHVRDLILNEDDLKSAQLAIENCGHMYAAMMQGAFENAARFEGIGRAVV